MLPLPLQARRTILKLSMHIGPPLAVSIRSRAFRFAPVSFSPWAVLRAASSLFSPSGSRPFPSVCQRASGALAAALGLPLLVLVIGCGHKQQAYVPPPAPAIANTAPVPYKTFPPAGSAGSYGTLAPPATASSAAGGIVASDTPADLAFVQSHHPIWVQTGVASWYGPPYDKHRGANGEIFDASMLSAAHRELPLGSLLRVTNLRNGESSVMRVTDRGPFVPGRVLDLSVASAKAIGVWAPGTASVQIEVYAAPKAIDEGGRWCVQIGAFKDKGKAFHLQQQLQSRYANANVIEFTGPTGHWVRIRPQGDNKQQAEEIESSVEPQEGAAYLTRLD
jgi:rare lipoprotein A